MSHYDIFIDLSRHVKAVVLIEKQKRRKINKKLLLFKTDDSNSLMN